ncbi:MAG: DUF134 domain-containing protein [Nanoarchaeota archaeon]|nr:DUF134 domain-containing protein [Nanoarchaeota archaeon]
MVRPTRTRRIFFQPDITYFKPAGIPMVNLKETILSFDELESIRLIDSEKMEQNKAGKKMKISQSTLSRLLREGRKNLADAILQGHAIKIQGGNFKMVKQVGRGFGRGLGGGGRMRRFAAGPGGICKCLKCGYEEPQVRGQPCTNKKCPKCQTQMVRG